MNTLSDDYNFSEPLPRSPTRQPYRGPRRRHRQTGQIETWVEGKGYVPEGSLDALPTQDRQQIEAARGGLSTARRNAQLAEQFTNVNRRTATGGLSGLPGMPSFLQSEGRQQMEGLTNQMLRANIKEGTSGTLNSIIEQILARQQYPTSENMGTVNFTRGLNMMVDADEMAQMLEEAEKWSTRNRGLQGFDTWWNQQSGPRREASRRRHLERYQRAWREGPYAEGARDDEPVYDTSGRRIR